MELAHAAAQMRAALRHAQEGLVERDVVVELIALAAVAREHLLVIGPPGTAKSEAVRRTARALGGSLFEYLLGRFTEPNEIFGPVDLQKLKEGVVETATAGMLPEADVASTPSATRSRAPCASRRRAACAARERARRPACRRRARASRCCAPSPARWRRRG
jgi:MoxR-like ATPase